MKRWSLLMAGSLAAVLLATGCSSTESQADFVGVEAAKQAALAHAGLSESEVTFTQAALDHRNGIDYYEVDFTADGTPQAYAVDALTGVIIDYRVPDNADTLSSVPMVTPATTSHSPTTPTTTPTQGAAVSTSDIGVERAQEIALSHAGLTADDVTFVRAQRDREDGRIVYEVEFYTADYSEFDYEIDAASGTIVSYDYDADYYTPPQVIPPADSSLISREKAISLALAKVPGATAAHIYTLELERDDGRVKYEGTILYQGWEYEFEIDAYSGAILEWDAEPQDD